MNIGESIRINRKLKKLSAREVGELVGVYAQAILQYERGERAISFTTLGNIANALGISVYDLIEQPKEKNELTQAMELVRQSFSKIRLISLQGDEISFLEELIKDKLERIKITEQRKNTKEVGIFESILSKLN